MQRIAKKIIVLALGWGFVALGLIGLFLPVLQGILFLLIGLLILATEYAWAHRLLQRIRARFPAIASVCDDAKGKAEHWIAKLHSRRLQTRASEPYNSATKPKDVTENI
jgi:uncharacterized membrane protein YbaN (DUF454 family)